MQVTDRPELRVRTKAKTSDGAALLATRVTASFREAKFLKKVGNRVRRA